MQKDVIQKIDLLVEMSDTNNHYDTLQEELRILDLDIARLKDSISDLTKSMVDTKYMKASDRLIDENIKISLENKLQTYAFTMKEIQAKIKEVSLEEDNYHQTILDLENEIVTSKKFLESLELKLKTIGSKDKSVYSFYEDLIETTMKEIKANESRLDVKKKAMESVQKRMESYAEARVSLDEKIKKDSVQLDETKAVLLNPKSYIDETARTSDEENVKKLNASLENLLNRRDEILNDPAYLGHEAKELLMDDDRTSTLSKVQTLVSIVASKPYMDYKFDDLDVALEEATLKRDEYANILESKKYDRTDSVVLEQRTEFLQSRKAFKLKEKEELEQKIREMDTTLVRKIMNSIAETKVVRDVLKDDIEEYKRVMEENNEYKTPKKKASLSAAFHRKCEELEMVYNIISSYERDLENVVTTSKVLEEHDLSLIASELKEIESEIQRIEKNKMLNNLPKDILAVEKDKSELKKLSDEVELIKERKKYKKSPKEVLDEIEMALGSMDYEEEKITNSEEMPSNIFRIDNEDVVEELVATPDVKEAAGIEEKKELEEVATQEKKEEILEEDILDPIVPEPTTIEPIMDLNSLIPEIEEETVKDLPPRKSSVPTNRFQVLSVESLDGEEESNSEEDYMVNDFQDTDYISFNDLLEGENKNAN